ncbi:MAG: thiamine pyrophosphate-binding protein, partial [Rhizonema sp. PD38]|nr:thiamine pyrophosphate-binding protein [Rhizonema sp. PD38]
MMINYTQTTSPTSNKPDRELQPNGSVGSLNQSKLDLVQSNVSSNTSVLSESDNAVSTVTVADAIATMLENLGVCCAFGVAGGAM